MKSLSLNQALPAILIAGVLLTLAWVLGMPGTAAGQGPNPDGITVMLVIDDSRSMASADPHQRRGLGGRLLIERLFPEDRIGTVLFSRSARVAQTVSPISGDENRYQLKTSFELLQSSGATDMLDALTKAFTELENDTPQNPKLVIFLTDGHLLSSEGESSEYQAAWLDLLRAYRSQDWPVFPVSFGRDVNTRFLENIAEVTGGETCDAPTDSELVACFQTVLDSFKETERVLEVPPGCLGPTESVEYPVYVDPYARQFSIVLERQESSPGVAVFDPTGAPKGAPRTEGNFLFYNFSNPETGTWLINLAGPGCFNESFAYIQSDVEIDLTSPGVTHAAHQPMEVQAVVQGRHPSGEGSWEPLSSELALSIASPEGSATPVPMSGPSSAHAGHYADTGEIGDYRLSFEATAEFPDPYTGQPMERTYLRQKRVEVVEAPVLELAVEGEQVYQILPGDSFDIRGRVTPASIASSPDLKATLSDGEARLDFAADGTFSGTVTPASAGKHKLDFTYETILAGRYGQVRYSTTESVDVEVDFQPLVLQVTRAEPDKKLVPGGTVSLIGRMLSGETPVETDQPSLTVGLVAPDQEVVEVELTAGARPGEYVGRFAPGESGPYTLSGVDTPLSRNGVPFTAETGHAMAILLRPALEIDVNALALGQVYPGAIVTRQLRVSNHSDHPISLVARTDSRDFSVDLSPVLVPASSEMQVLEAQFQVNSQAGAGGGGAPAGLFLGPNSGSSVEPGLVIPVTYEFGDFFVEPKTRDYHLGYIRRDSGDIPIHLELDFNTPVPVKLTAVVSDADGKSVHEFPLPQGQGSSTVPLVLPLPQSRGPGAHQGSVRLTTEPPIPVRHLGEVNFSYRVPSPLESWVLNNWWWMLSAGTGAALATLLVWGGVISQRVTLQGRLLIYDRLGLTRARREDLRRFGRTEVTIGCQADVSLPDPSGMIDREHALIVASDEMPYPRVYPLGIGRVTGPFGEQLNASGAPLGDGDTFSIGQYNLEWSPTWAKTRIGRVLGDPWWKLGLLAAVGAVIGVAAAFYLVLL